MYNDESVHFSSPLLQAKLVDRIQATAFIEKSVQLLQLTTEKELLDLYIVYRILRNRGTGAERNGGRNRDLLRNLRMIKILNTRFFRKKHFYMQQKAEIGLHCFFISNHLISNQGSALKILCNF